MKKVSKFLSGALFSLSLIFPLTACGQNGKNSDFKKVQKAFNGVESSLREKQKAPVKRNSLHRNEINEGPSSALDALSSLFESKGESRGDTIDDLEFNQPPMIQFQCLKTVFDSTGEDFTFSNKYYDTIKGDVYFDINTGEEKNAQSGDEYHYTYDFLLSLGIKFEDSLITADISFDITLNQENNHCAP